MKGRRERRRSNMAISCRRKKTRFNTSKRASVCVAQGKGGEEGGGDGEGRGRAAPARDTRQLRRFAYVLTLFLRRLSAFVVYSSVRSSTQAGHVTCPTTRGCYSRKAWNSTTTSATSAAATAATTTTITYTHAGSRTLFSFRSARNLSLARATEKQHPASFSVLVSCSSSNARERCTLSFSHAYSSFLPLSLSLPLYSLSPTREAANERINKKKKKLTPTMRAGARQVYTNAQYPLSFFFFPFSKTVRYYEDNARRGTCERASCVSRTRLLSHSLDA